MAVLLYARRESLSWRDPALQPLTMGPAMACGLRLVSHQLRFSEYGIIKLKDH